MIFYYDLNFLCNNNLVWFVQPSWKVSTNDLNDHKLSQLSATRKLNWFLWFLPAGLHMHNFSKWQRLQWMKWERPVIFWHLETRRLFFFCEKKNPFSIENDYIKSWCGLNAGFRAWSGKKYTLVIEQHCANYLVYSVPS